MKKFVWTLFLTTFLVGCSPRLSPLYRDYEVTVEEGLSDELVFERIDRGLKAAGWSPIEGITANVLATESRQFREWGLYSIEVELEVAPVSGDYVRLLIHPYRVYFTGKRSKIPYLRGSLARSVLKDLHDEFDKEGLTFIGTAQSRDKAVLK
ncbi:hypothetical protein HQ496_00610 [bacterium]|nr:hypothetical protein [bacterium]